MLIGQSDGTTTLTFSYDANGNVVSMFNGISRYYYQRNGQNDIVGILNSSGTQVVAYTYDTWGKLLSVTGSLATTIGAQNPFRYRGYYYDNETGFYYLQSRYYDPTTGRFISPDVLVSTGQGIVGHNMYAYCLNNPVNRTDDSGYGSWLNTLKTALMITAVIAVAAAAVAATVVTAGAAVPALAAVGAGTFSTTAATVALTSFAVTSMEVAATCTIITAGVEMVETISYATTYDSDPYARPGQKKQGRERKNKARQNPKWEPRSNPKPPKKHTLEEGIVNLHIYL